MFVVGDAAGQCLPVTGEGIRPALYFGTLAGQIVQRVLEGKLTLDQGLSRYRRAVLLRRRAYRALELVQRWILTAPHAWTEAAFAAASRPRFFSWFWPTYAGGLRPRSYLDLC